MKNLKKALPLAALLLGITAYGVQATIAKVSTATDQQWIYSPPAMDDDPTNPAYYSYHPENDLETACNDGSQICGVKAPSSNPGNPSSGQPVLTSLETDLEQGNPNPDIFRGEFNQ